MRIIRSKVVLVEILKPISYMPINSYIQEATISYCGKYVYVKRGSSGGLSISIKHVKILAENILYDE